MPSPASRALAARPTRCCICWRSRARLAFRLQIDDFQKVSERTPLLADLKPSGRFVAADVHKRRRHSRHREAPARRQALPTGSTLTVTGKTFAEEASAAVETPGQQVIAPLDKPLKKTGGLVILHGNLAPEGCVAKISGHERLTHRGPARVFESEEDAMTAVTGKRIKAGDVVVIRNEGPKGGPGMREMLSVTGGDRRRRTGRIGRAAHRRPLQRRHPRPDDGPRLARGGAGRTDRRRPRRRHDSHRHEPAAARSRDQRR